MPYQAETNHISINFFLKSWRFSIFWQKLDGANKSEMDIKVLIYCLVVHKQRKRKYFHF